MATDGKDNILTKDQMNYLLEPERSPGDSEKIRILIAEDDPVTQFLYDKGLSDRIFTKKTVASGKEAILVYNEWHPDIIVLDIYLLEITGYQVLKAIRSVIKDKTTTIVMATSLSDREDILSCTNLGVEGYIVKPFSPKEIMGKILSCYAKKEPERARKAVLLCRELAPQSQDPLSLDKK